MKWFVKRNSPKREREREPLKAFNKFSRESKEEFNKEFLLVGKDRPDEEVHNRPDFERVLMDFFG